MANLTEVVVTATANPGTYPASPQVVSPFSPKEYTFINTSPTAVLHISFDGVNDHEFSDPAILREITRGAMGADMPTKVWVRRDVAGADVAKLRVAARS